MKMYKTISGLQRDIRKNTESLPYEFILMGNLYRQCYYDGSGNVISWNSITDDSMVDMVTENRYKYGWKDCILSIN
jgi:hypothetical protein